MKPTSKLLMFAGCVITLLASGCSDNNNSSAAGNSSTVPIVAETFVPDSASVSNDAFMAYLQSLNGADESSEALTVKESFAVSADEVNDPKPLV